MKILLAPNALKECLSAFEAAIAMERGVRRALPNAEIVSLPLGDGGDGTAESLTRALGGRFMKTRVEGPLGKPVVARWGILKKPKQSPLALLDMAEASGLKHVPPRRRNPMKTSTFGTGQLLIAALDKGCRHIVLGLGGSATVDAGLGMAQALGGKFFDAKGKLLKRGGAELEKLARMDLSGLDARLKETSLWIASDVRNPLLGARGAAKVFGPQKGANPAQVRQLDRGLKNFARLAKRDLGKDVAGILGAGAAGGLGAGLFAFFNARPQPADILLFPMLQVERRIRRADLIFTAEGKVDGQSAEGKASSILAVMAHRWRKPLYVLAGELGPGCDKLLEMGATAVVRITPRNIGLAEAFRSAKKNLQSAAEDITRKYSGFTPR